MDIDDYFMMFNTLTSLQQQMDILLNNKNNLILSSEKNNKDIKLKEINRQINYTNNLIFQQQEQINSFINSNFINQDNEIINYDQWKKICCNIKCFKFRIHNSKFCDTHTNN